MEMNYMSILESVGQVLGIPAVAGVCYLIFTLKNITARLAKVERDNELLKGTLGDIKSDIAYIRGKMEGDR